MIKYTLYCEPGKMLHPGLHTCVIGDWINPEGHIVLTQGTMTEAEYKKFTTDGFIRLYDRWQIKWIGIYSGLGSARWMEDGLLSAGVLHRKSYNVYEGHVHLKLYGGD